MAGLGVTALNTFKGEVWCLSLLTLGSWMSRWWVASILMPSLEMMIVRMARKQDDL